MFEIVDCGKVSTLASPLWNFNLILNLYTKGLQIHGMCVFHAEQNIYSVSAQWSHLSLLGIPTY